MIENFMRMTRPKEHYDNKTYCNVEQATHTDLLEDAVHDVSEDPKSCTTLRFHHSVLKPYSTLRDVSSLSEGVCHVLRVECFMSTNGLHSWYSICMSYYAGS